MAATEQATTLKTMRNTSLLRAACAGLLLAAEAGVHAAPMTIPAMKKSVASLLAGHFAAANCHGIQVDQEPTGVLTISSDGHVVGPQIDVSLFEPGGELLLERYVDGEPKTLTVHVSVHANGKSLSLERAVPSDSPGFLEAGLGAPNANVTRGAECSETDFSSARISAPTFDLASYVAPMFATTGPVKGMCRSLKHGAGRARPSQFVLDAHGVVVDGVPLPFASAAQPVVRTGVGSRFSDGTVNGGFDWADGSSFHVERFFESEGVSTFSFTIHGKPDAEKMFCQPAH